jgi:6-phosphogluconate dehydrogenase
MMMVKAGKPVDDFIEQVLPHLEDGRHHHRRRQQPLPDTIRRTEYVESKGKLYIGTGVSGGEEGALLGPSIMPGGSPAPGRARQADLPEDRRPRPTTANPAATGSAKTAPGHFVKMVHNGIEYGDMQMICETYQMMKEGLGMTNDEMHEVFAEWNKGELDSYLIEITRDILGYKDEDGKPRGRPDPRHRRPEGHRQMDRHRRAGPRPAADADRRGGVRPLPVGDQGRARGRLKVLKGPDGAKFDGDKAALVDDLRRRSTPPRSSATPRATSSCAPRPRVRLEPQLRRHRLMWRGGCIIRSVFLGKIKEAFDKTRPGQPAARPVLQDAVTRRRRAWRRVCHGAVEMGIPMPAISAALAYYDGYRTNGCRPTCCRRSATTSAPTPTSASTSRAASSSTPTGPAAAAQQPHQHTTSRKRTSSARASPYVPKSSKGRARLPQPSVIGDVLQW